MVSCLAMLARFPKLGVSVLALLATVYSASPSSSGSSEDQQGVRGWHRGRQAEDGDRRPSGRQGAVFHDVLRLLSRRERTGAPGTVLL